MTGLWRPWPRFAAATFAVCVVAGASPRTARAQTTVDSAAADAVFARAQALVQSGNAGAGRLLVDSVLAVRSPDSLSYAEALFWRASLAPNDVAAERDYQRIVVDYPLSPRSADALLELASLEHLRGDDDAAAEHLHRFLLENPNHAGRGSASYQLAEILLARNDRTRGCTELAHAQRAVPDSLVELRNRIEFDAQRCVGVDTVGVAKAAPASARTSSRASSPSPDNAAGGGYTFQVGAFPSLKGADALAAKLRKRGYDVRVLPGKLNRVQIGRYKTRTEANAAAKRIKSRGIDGFVTEVSSGSGR
jgi:TolA-binding protein